MSRRALQTRRQDDGALAISLLRGLDGRQRAVTQDLEDNLVGTFRPDVVNVTTPWASS